MSAGFPVQTGTRFSASAGARAPSPSDARSLVLLPCCGRTRRSGAANAAGSAARAPSAKDSRSQPRRRLQSARGRCPPLGSRERQPSRDREFARSSAGASALTGAARPLGLQQVAEEGDWGSRLNPGRPASLPEGLKECEGGAARPARDARPAAARQHPSALRVPALGRLGSASWPVTGLERTRDSGLGALQLRGAAAPLPHLGRQKVKWKTVAELSPPPFPLAPQPRPRVGEVRSAGLEGKQAAWAAPPPPSSRPRPRGFTQHFFVLKAPPPPRGFSPRGRLTGGWGIEQSVHPPFSPEPSPYPPRGDPRGASSLGGHQKGGRALEG